MEFIIDMGLLIFMIPILYLFIDLWHYIVTILIYDTLGFLFKSISYLFIPPLY